MLKVPVYTFNIGCGDISLFVLLIRNENPAPLLENLMVMLSKCSTRSESWRPNRHVGDWYQYCLSDFH